MGEPASAKALGKLWRSLGPSCTRPCGHPGSHRLAFVASGLYCKHQGSSLSNHKNASAHAVRTPAPPCRVYGRSPPESLQRLHPRASHPCWATFSITVSSGPKPCAHGFRADYLRHSAPSRAARPRSKPTHTSHWQPTTGSVFKTGSKAKLVSGLDGMPRCCAAAAVAILTPVHPLYACQLRRHAPPHAHTLTALLILMVSSMVCISELTFLVLGAISPARLAPAAGQVAQPPPRSAC